MPLLQQIEFISSGMNLLRKVFPNVRKWDIGVMDTPVVVRVA